MAREGELTKESIKQLIRSVEVELNNLSGQVKKSLSILRDFVFLVRKSGCTVVVDCTADSGSIVANITDSCIVIDSDLGGKAYVEILGGNEAVVEGFTIHTIGTLRYLPGVIERLEKLYLEQVKCVLTVQPNFDEEGGIEDGSS